MIPLGAAKRGGDGPGYAAHSTALIDYPRGETRQPRAIPEARRTARETRAVLAAAKPVLDRTPPVLRNVDTAAAGLLPILTALDPLVRRLGPIAGDLGPLVAEVRSRELLRRLSRSLPKIGELTALQRSALTTSRKSLTGTRNLEALTAQSLEIQRQLLSHVEAIDRKLPGPTG